MNGHARPTRPVSNAALAAAIGLLCIGGTAAHAQFQLPFGRIDIDPNGGIRVQSPYIRIETVGRPPFGIPPQAAAPVPSTGRDVLVEIDPRVPVVLPVPREAVAAPEAALGPAPNAPSAAPFRPGAASPGPFAPNLGEGSNVPFDAPRPTAPPKPVPPPPAPGPNVGPNLDGPETPILQRRPTGPVLDPFDPRRFGIVPAGGTRPTTPTAPATPTASANPTPPAPAVVPIPTTAPTTPPVPRAEYVSRGGVFVPVLGQGSTSPAAFEGTAPPAQSLVAAPQPVAASQDTARPAPADPGQGPQLVGPVLPLPAPSLPTPAPVAPAAPQPIAPVPAAPIPAPAPGNAPAATVASYLIVPVPSDRPAPLVGVTVVDPLPGGAAPAAPYATQRGTVVYRLRPMRHGDVPNVFEARGGLHVFAFVHPTTGETVPVVARLPEGQPRVEIRNSDVEFDYGRYEVEIDFRSNGAVYVK